MTAKWYFWNSATYIDLTVKPIGNTDWIKDKVVELLSKREDRELLKEALPDLFK